jgi:dTDP-4-amino-4,6-dideoxygalactose transaminase
MSPSSQTGAVRQPGAAGASDATPSPAWIPQTDPRASYLAYRAEIDRAVARVLEAGAYILGPEVAALESEFAACAGVRHAVGVASGTDALTLALGALGVGPGDLVVTASHTAVATVAAIELAGATPLLVDIDGFFTLDPEAVAAALDGPDAEGRVRAIVPVHLYGQPCDLGALVDVARRRSLFVVEDCAQAHGAAWHGRPVGAFGECAAWSLYPTKNLGAVGDGGMVTTDRGDVDARVRSLREYGWRERYVSDSAGRNSRLDPLQAAIVKVKLAHLADDNARRAAIAAAYDAGFAGLPLTLPARRAGATHAHHQYVIASDDRDALRDRLRALGVGTLVHYPVPVHLQPAYRGRLPIGPGGLPRTERAAGRILSLPMYPQLTDDDVTRVIEAVRRACGAGPTV